MRDDGLRRVFFSLRFTREFAAEIAAQEAAAEEAAAAEALGKETSDKAVAAEAAGDQKPPGFFGKLMKLASAACMKRFN